MIYVFKTSVKKKKDIKRIKPHLEALIGSSKWNFDLEDCDKILRVESQKNNTFEIITLLNKLDFNCEELPD